MTHTDDELEAMAARLCVPWDAERSTVSQTIHWMKERRETAAMLRACKGRVRVKPLVWERARDGAGWHHQLTIAYCPVFEKRFYAEHPEKHARIEAAREARILAALEPAPDHEIWNAAIEAAALTAFDCVFYDSAGSGFDEDKFNTAIRTLKKGPHDA